MSGYPFPGNIRELENLIKRVVVLQSEDAVIASLIRGGDRASGRGLQTFHRVVEEMEATAGEIPLRDVGRRAAIEAEREAIHCVLLRTSWNRKQAAQLLGVSYKTLLQKIRDCGLEPG